MATANCRASAKHVTVKRSSASGAWTHLKGHDLISTRTTKLHKKARAEKDRKVAVAATGLESKNPRRFFLLTMVYAYIIRGLMPFTHFQKPAIRAALSDVIKPGLDCSWLHWETVRHTIVEYYVATKSQWTKHLARTLRSALVPSLTWQVDLWTSKSSGEKYMGE
jgi:hypothetical protein